MRESVKHKTGDMRIGEIRAFGVRIPGIAEWYRQRIGVELQKSNASRQYGGTRWSDLDDLPRLTDYCLSVRIRAVATMIGAGAIAAGFAAVIGMTWWRGVMAAEPGERHLLMIAGAGMVAAMGAIVVIARMTHGHEMGAAAPSSPQARATRRKRVCRGLSSVFVGPAATVLLLSALYAAFRFDAWRGLGMAMWLLWPSAVLYALYACCAYQNRRDVSGR